MKLYKLWSIALVIYLSLVFGVLFSPINTSAAGNSIATRGHQSPHVLFLFLEALNKKIGRKNFRHPNLSPGYVPSPGAVERMGSRSVNHPMPSHRKKIHRDFHAICDHPLSPREVEAIGKEQKAE